MQPASLTKNILCNISTSIFLKGPGQKKTIRSTSRIVRNTGLSPVGSSHTGSSRQSQLHDVHSPLLPTSHPSPHHLLPPPHPKPSRHISFCVSTADCPSWTSDDVLPTQNTSPPSSPNDRYRTATPRSTHGKPSPSRPSAIGSTHSASTLQASISPPPPAQRYSHSHNSYNTFYMHS